MLTKQPDSFSAVARIIAKGDPPKWLRECPEARPVTPRIV
jgi:hypothetical protein